MLNDRFGELEKKIKSASDIINKLKQEKAELEMKYEEAQRKITELTDEMDQYRRDEEEFTIRVEGLLDYFVEFPENVEDDQGDGLSVVEPFTVEDDLEKELSLEANEDLDNYMAQFELGRSYEKKGLWEKAIEAYHRAIDLKPDFVDAIEHLAFLLEKLNREKEASPLWEKVISLKK